MKILAFIPAYRRPAITRACYLGLIRLARTAPIGINLEGLAIVSDTTDEGLAAWFSLSTCRAANKPLGRKFNAGLKYALDNFEFDYILQLNSDNILSISFWEAFGPMIAQRLPFFGCNHIAFYDSTTGQALRYLYGTGCGIRFIRRDVLEGAAWQVQVNNPQARSASTYHIPEGLAWIPEAQYKERLFGPALAREFRLWPPDINRGLDFNSERTLRRAFPAPEYRQRFPQGTEPLALDIKSDTNIHPFDEFTGDDHAQPWSREEALALFPELAEVVKPNHTQI